MTDPIYYHLYNLSSHHHLNVKSKRQEHKGALIRVGEGFGCIHPWEVFGDEPIEEHLAELSAGRQTRLVSKALECAEIDASARVQGESLFNRLDIPESHATVVGGMDEIDTAVNRGFRYVKIKAGSHVEKDAAFINAVAEAYAELRLRVDFNCNLLGSQVGDFVEALSDKARSAIDFLEDPCGYKDSCWTGLRSLYGIPLAMDIGVERIDALYSFAVIKPAKNDVDRVMENTRTHARKAVITSYMEHPIGQAFAAYEAGRAMKKYMGLVDVCGLMTHELFEPTAFSEALGKSQPDWTYSKGTGLGFNQELEEVEWTRLS